ncbi:hypothetical protein PIB30_096990 [Stylosanthes scabra]|uniref:Uncharacterized protein n=1 Tax=Stylosanthes scabra TaxID=79078 RepID=A0ABU6TY88_9FABA|nr:hypothetical protein [Stylosanthes scabra]
MKETLETGVDHLYLMVVDIPNGKIYIFNTLPLHPLLIARKQAVKSMAAVLDGMLKAAYPDVDVLGPRPHLAAWYPEVAPGIPIIETSYIDKLWVLLRL